MGDEYQPFHSRNSPVEKPRKPLWEKKPFARVGAQPQKENTMPKLMTIAVEPIVALIAGILILLQPQLLNYIVAIYLILVGVLGLMHHP